MFFPVSIDINEKKCLVIGGGNLAYRKIQTLLHYGAKIDVITEEIREEKIKDADISNLFIETYENQPLDKYFLVIAATDNKDLNDKIVKICNEKNILVNNITSKENMSMRFGAIYEDDDYQVLVTTHGKHCSTSKSLRDEIGDFIKDKQ